MVVKLLGNAVRVVATESFHIDEHAGNVASKDDTLSIAHVTVEKPGEEPWLTLHCVSSCVFVQRF